MTQDTVRIVEFGDIWKMAIDIPYSLMAGRGAQAWTCGQLAMSVDGKVMAADDFATQAQIVRDYGLEILRRAGLSAGNMRRIVNYYIPGETDREAMLFELLTQAFGDDVLIDFVPLPHFYYDGILLECDFFCGPKLIQKESRQTAFGSVEIRLTDSDAWVSVATSPGDVATMQATVLELLNEYGMGRENALTEHWLAPSHALTVVAREGAGLGEGFDPLAVVNMGPSDMPVRARFRLLRGEAVSSRVMEAGGLTMLVRTAKDEAWMQARPSDPAMGLEDATRAAMEAFSSQLAELGYSFADVGKQTTHYVGGSSDELHDNMQVRNSYYSKPGPASTGVPVHGLADGSAATVIDLTLVRDWRK